MAQEERERVVRAFASNDVVHSIEMVNALVNDKLAIAWGEVLLSNDSITSLNLESNSISSSGIEALAAGLKANSRLRQL